MTAARILVTGSRNWIDEWAVGAALEAAIDEFGDREVIVVHGDCPTGADAIAGRWADVSGQPQERHPADWGKHGRAAGPLRNQAMVDLGADICIAFPLGNSRGTHDCMRRATAAGIPVRVIGVSS